MKINREIIHKIIDRSKSNFIDFPNRLYWENMRKTEMNFEEKRMICLIETIGKELNFDLEFDYFKELLDIAED